MNMHFKTAAAFLLHRQASGYKIDKRIPIGAGTAMAVALAISSVAFAAASPAVTSAISARKANFKEIGGAFKSINDEVKSGAPDMRIIRPLARDIAARAALQLKFFPKGSGPESAVKTRAKGAIWKDFATFTKLQKDMMIAANALNTAAAAGNVAAFDSARNSLGATCKSCHEKFREEG